MEERFTELIDRCVADVRAGRSLAECVEAFPDERETLEALLPLALAITPIEVEADPQRRLAGRVALVEALHRERQRSGLARWWFQGAFARPRMAVPVAAIAVVLALTVTTTVAASEAQPGDPLYGLKTGIEQVHVVVAFSPEAKAQVRLDIAATRLVEVERALASGKKQAAQAAATSYAATMTQVAETIEATGRGGFARRLWDRLATTVEHENLVIASASAAGADATQEALQRARDQGERAREQLELRMEVPASLDVPPTGTVATPAAGGGGQGVMQPGLTPTPRWTPTAPVSPQPTGRPTAVVFGGQGVLAPNLTPSPTTSPTSEGLPQRGFALGATITAEPRDGLGLQTSTPLARPAAVPPIPRGRSDEGSDDNGPRSTAPTPTPRSLALSSPTPGSPVALDATPTAVVGERGRGRDGGGSEDDDRGSVQLFSTPARSATVTPSTTPSATPRGRGAGDDEDRGPNRPSSSTPTQTAVLPAQGTATPAPGRGRGGAAEESDAPGSGRRRSLGEGAPGSDPTATPTLVARSLSMSTSTPTVAPSPLPTATTRTRAPGRSSNGEGPEAALETPDRPMASPSAGSSAETRGRATGDLPTPTPTASAPLVRIPQATGTAPPTPAPMVSAIATVAVGDRSNSGTARRAGVDEPPHVPAVRVKP